MSIHSETDIVSESARHRAQIEAFAATTVGNLGISATNLKKVRVRVPSAEVLLLLYAGVMFSSPDAMGSSDDERCGGCSTRRTRRASGHA